MALERKWFAARQSFIANGTANGLITVKDTAGFYVNQRVNLTSDTIPSAQFFIKRIEGPNHIYLRSLQPFNSPYSNLSAYVLIDNPIIVAAEQDKPNLKGDEWEQWTHEHEPILAKRVIAVDKYGNFYSEQNPMPVANNSDWDDVVLSYDFNQNMTEAVFTRDSEPLRTYTMEYDIDDNLIHATKTKN